MSLCEGLFNTSVFFCLAKGELPFQGFEGRHQVDFGQLHHSLLAAYMALKSVCVTGLCIDTVIEHGLPNSPNQIPRHWLMEYSDHPLVRFAYDRL